MGQSDNAATNRRKHARSRTQEITIHLNGETYTTHDWSPSGFSLSNIPANYEVGQQLNGAIEISTFPDFEEFSAEVTRLNPDHIMAVKFTEITSQGYINMCSLSINPEKNVIQMPSE